MNVGNSLDVIYQNVVKGTTDYAADGLSPTVWAGIAKTYGINKKQFFIRPQLGVDYLALNHDPGRTFDKNSQLAKAVNYAVDRRAYLAQRGFLAGQKTNRILPPGMAGVTRATQVLKGSYPVKAPNIKKAKQLAAGHTGDGKVLMWSPNTRRRPAAVSGRAVQPEADRDRCLDQASPAGAAVRDRAEPLRGDLRHQLVGLGRGLSDPFDFINILLDGTTIGPTANNNDAYYNNAKFNKAMQKASLITPRPGRNAAYRRARRHHDEQGSAVGAVRSTAQSAFRLLPLGVLRLQPGDEPRLRCSLQEVAAGNASRGGGGPAPRRPERGQARHLDKRK